MERKFFDGWLRDGRSTRSSAVVTRCKDVLDELIEESTKRDPRFPELLAEAVERRERAKRLVAARTEKGLSPTMVAAAMRTAQSVVSKLEAGSDVRLSKKHRSKRSAKAPTSARRATKR